MSSKNKSAISEYFKDIIDSFRNTFNDAKKRYDMLLVIMLLDILFFIIYGFITAGFFQNVSESSSQFIQALISGSPQTSSLFYSTLLYYFIFLILFYITYSFIQGASWFFAHKINGNKISYWSFFKLNLLWIPIIFVFVTFQYMRRIAGVLNNQSTVAGDYVFYALMIILIYFMIISYANNSFSVKKAIKLENIFLFLILIILFAILNFILQLTLNVPYLTLILGLITVIPLIAMARVMFVGINQGSN